MSADIVGNAGDNLLGLSKLAGPGEFLLEVSLLIVGQALTGAIKPLVDTRGPKDAALPSTAIDPR
jgi:hypothetical protein